MKAMKFEETKMTISICCTALLLWIIMPNAVVGEEDDHGDHGEERVVRLSAEEIKEFGVKVEESGPGKLPVYVELPGEVVVDPDRLAHVVPRVGGVVRQVRKKLGDPVSAGEILAVIDSRELSELKSGYLVDQERAELAAATFTREENLWKEEISSEKEYLEAKRVLAEARIEMRAAEQKLHALGFSHEYLENITFANDEHFTRYEIDAPFDGIIIEKHITYGEMIKDDAEAFVIADLSSVWALLTVYQKDLSRIEPGQVVRISLGAGSPGAEGSISYISPVVNEGTRTTQARVVLPNPEGRWRPGSFISGKLAVGESEVPLVVPKSAVQIVDGEPSVFVETAEGFEPQTVRVGRVNETHVEISAGLVRGQRYVAAGAFTLKAQLAKGAFGDGHGH
jgi:cobalt-zinc-cadmium efflux system membrane fusion protein